MERALEMIINAQTVSTSYLQRKLGIGYYRAAEIIDKLLFRHGENGQIAVSASVNANGHFIIKGDS